MLFKVALTCSAEVLCRVPKTGRLQCMIRRKLVLGKLCSGMTDRAVGMNAVLRNRRLYVDQLMKLL